MISITDNKDCCGCEACRQKCPKQCIEMVVDNEGFRYPQVDTARCINCNLCESVCPVINVGKPQESKPSTYAGFCRDEDIRRESSSGGIFSVLAESCIKEGGVVFGTRFDDKWNAVCDFTETSDGLKVFRGSKYMQSSVADSYRNALSFLREGRKVLFSGTPCQVAGLKRFLGKEYDNLITVDFVCHGVPSPLVWDKYLEHTLRTSCATIGKNTDYLSLNSMPIMDISFRDKRMGWKKYGIRLGMPLLKDDKNLEYTQSANKNGEFFEPFPSNSFMRVFLSDLSLRPSCYACKAKGFRSGSDITIGDFWGIEKVDPAIDDNQGMSLVIVHNNAVMKWLSSAGVFLKEESFQDALSHNPSIAKSMAVPAYRNYFFKKLNDTMDFGKAYEAVFSQKTIKRLQRRFWLRFIRKVT